MKVGIVTTSYALNYGAVLQAYALERYLNSNGYDCEIIDYRPNKQVYGRNLYFKNNSLKSIIKNLLILANPTYKKKHRQKIAMFDDFLNERLKLSDKKYYNQSDFIGLSCYDAFICGSDQIWNLNLMDDPIFYLPFNKECNGKKFIAYAPSIAETLTNSQLKLIGERVRHFDALSIRESIGANLLSKNINRNVDSVLDPVFLLSSDEWKELIPKNQMKEKYILCYFLGVNEVARKTVERLKKITGFDVVNIGLDPKGVLKVDIDMTNISPLEYVSMIEGAEFICTNSFHATAFSIIFKKRFYTIKHATRNSRMDNLFTNFNITGKIISNEDEIEYITKEDIYKEKNIDYLKAQDHVKYSMEYLNNSLNSSKE